MTSLDRWARNLRVMLESLGTLAKHNVTLVSITEQIDYSTPQGKLMMQMLGGFAEFYSGSLATHVKKGVTERARQGRHLGAVPFGYRPCSVIGCEPEHPGGVHVLDGEAEAVRKLFKRYASGTTTTVQLASWMNAQGHRTMNRHRFGGADAEGRFFTNASIRGLLHNAFFGGKVKHNDELVDGVHEPLISWALFEQVQDNLKHNAGRSQTLAPKPAREYLLKGLIRCAHCGMPLWAPSVCRAMARKTCSMSTRPWRSISSDGAPRSTMRPARIINT